MYSAMEIKINEIIDLLNNSEVIHEMVSLKKELLNNEAVAFKLKEYEELLIHPYDTRCIEIKKELLAIPAFSKYKRYEEELYLLVLNINLKLKEILKEKSCSK